MTTASAKQIASSSVLLLAENLIRLLAVAAVSFWIARQLGPGQFGILNFASAFAAILLAVSTLGMDTPVILRLTQTQQSRPIMAAVLALRAIVSVIVFIAAVLIALVLKHNDSVAFNTTVIVSLGIILNTPAVFDYWFKANTNAAPAALARISGTLLSAAAKVLCLYLGLGVEALAWTVAFEAAVTSIVFTLVYFKNSESNKQQGNFTAKKKTMAKLLLESWPYLLSMTAVVAYMKIDVVILGYLSTNTETGIYSLSQKLSEVLYMIPVVLIDSLYPTLTKKYLNVDNTLKNQGQMLFDVAVGASIIATLTSIALSGIFIKIIFGDGYQKSIDVFYVHSWSCIAIAMNTARHRWLATLQLQRYIPIVTTIGLGSNIICNLFLIPEYGAIGAAYATLISYFISGYACSFVFPSLKPVGWEQTRALFPWIRLYRIYKGMGRI